MIICVFDFLEKVFKAFFIYSIFKKSRKFYYIRIWMNNDNTIALIIFGAIDTHKECSYNKKMFVRI